MKVHSDVLVIETPSGVKVLMLKDEYELRTAAYGPLPTEQGKVIGDWSCDNCPIRESCPEVELPDSEQDSPAAMFATLRGIATRM